MLTHVTPCYSSCILRNVVSFSCIQTCHCNLLFSAYSLNVKNFRSRCVASWIIRLHIYSDCHKRFRCNFPSRLILNDRSRAHKNCPKNVPKLWRCLATLLCPRPGGIIISAAYIGPKSRMERSRKTKLARRQPTSHVTRIPLSRSKGQRSRSPDRFGWLYWQGNMYIE